MKMNEDNEDQVLEWAHLAVPRECGGVVIGEEAFLVTNLAPDDELSMFMPDISEIEDLVAEYGMFHTLWHSHPRGKPRPSKIDTNHHPDGFGMVIVTLTEVIYVAAPSPAVLESAGKMGV